MKRNWAAVIVNFLFFICHPADTLQHIAKNIYKYTVYAYTLHMSTHDLSYNYYYQIM